MIAAIVLAAGEGSRFGGRKQLVHLGGKPLLEHVLQTLRRSIVDDVVVVLGAHAEAIETAIHFESERRVTNHEFAQGMSTSIRAGLRALADDAEAALIVLGDQPFVATSTINRLIEEYRRVRARIVIPTFEDKRGNPVLIERSLFGEMMSLQGDTGGRAIFERHGDVILLVPVNDRGVVTDVDTAADLPVLE